MRWWQIKKRNADLERELRSDLELEEEEQRENGLPPEEAHYAARRAFGNTALIKEQTHEAWGWAVFERFLQDVRYAFRQLRKNAGFAAICTITLALGIGATTTIFSVVDSLLLRPLPYPNAPRIVRIWNTFAPRGMTEIPFSEPEFNEYRESQSFAHVAGFSVGTLTLTGSGDPLHVAASWGTQDFFAVMGTAPFLSRVFTTDEQQQEHPHVAVLSHRLWQSRFASSREIIGTSIVLNGQSCTVVGVMPPTFNFPSDDVDVWQPLPIAPASDKVGNHYLNLIADLKPQTTLSQARSEMATILDRILRKYPRYYGGAAGLGVNLIPLREQMVGNLRPTVLVLMAGVGFMLLIACTNVASLHLARGEDRKQEIATRTALGATRWRILYQVLIENLVLFLAGGGLGLLLAFVCVKGLNLQIWVDLRSMTLVVRTSAEPENTVSAIRAQLKQLDPQLPIYKVSTLKELVSSSMSQTRFPALTLSLFACAALLLAAIGVYGVLAYTVAQSRHEIGVRMALGAQQGQILKFFLRQGVKWAALGGSAGLLAALILVRFMRSMLFKVGPYDPRILLTVTAVLSAVVLAACLVPALRAARVDPITALKNE